jgi:hypothetical protein
LQAICSQVLTIKTAQWAQKIAIENIEGIKESYLNIKCCSENDFKPLSYL